MAAAQVVAPTNDVEKAKYQYSKVSLSLENCILPPDKLSPSPSQLDGLDPEAEVELRILGCELIQISGILLKLPQVAMATGQVLFQRFFYSKSFVRQPMEVVAMACITLASKIEEAPRRIRDVVNVCHHIKQVKSGKTIQPLILDQNYINQKNQVIKAERRVLKELGFCVHVKHPHKISEELLSTSPLNASRGGYHPECQLLTFQICHCLKICYYTVVILSFKRGFTANFSFSSSKKEEIEKQFPHGDLIYRNYMNDSLRTEVFVRYDPETIACGCIHLSARLLQIPLPNKPSWYLVFGVSEKDINDISHAILSLYTRRKPDPEKLEKLVEELRKTHMEAKLRAKGQNAINNVMNSSPSQPNSPRNGTKSPGSDGKKERNDKHHNDTSPKYHKDSNHRKRRSPSHSEDGYGSDPKKRPKSSSSGSATSPSPRTRKQKTPPRGFKDSSSRSRSSKKSKHGGRSSAHGSKRKHSPSPAPPQSDNSKKYSSSKSRAGGRSQERNHHEKSHKSRRGERPKEHSSREGKKRR